MKPYTFLKKLNVCSEIIMKGDRKNTIIFYSFFALFSVLTLVEPFGLREFINYLGDGNQGLVPVILFLIVTMLFRQFSGTTELLARTRLQDSIPHVYEVELIKKMNSLSLEQVEDSHVQDLLFKSKRLNLSKSVVNTYNVFIDAASLIVIFFLLWYFGSLLVAVVVLLFSGIQVYAQIFQAKKIEDIARSQGGELRFLDRLFRLGLERESNMEVRVLLAAPYLLQRWKVSMERLASTIAQHEFKAAVKKIPPVFLYFLIQAVMAVFVGWVVIQERMTAGDFVFLFTLVNLFSDLATGFSGKLSVVIRDSRMAEDLLQFLNLDANQPAKTTLQESVNVVQENNSNAVVTLRDVTYRYPAATSSALQNIDLTIKAGETIAIIGEMGSGKSTLVKVLTGLLQPDGGEVWWKEPVAQANGQQQPVTTVFQDFIRYHMTTQENIGLGHVQDYQNTEKMIGLLQGLGLPNNKDFLEQQLGTVFGGIDLSGGQWQRVAIARALMKPSKLVTFDEPTSALDPKAELDLIQLFLSMTGDKAKVIVTHRLAAAKKADRAIVMEKGQIVEAGTHQELMNLNGRYHELFESQAGWYAEEV